MTATHVGRETAKRNTSYGVNICTVVLQLAVSEGRSLMELLSERPALQTEELDWKDSSLIPVIQ